MIEIKMKEILLHIFSQTKTLENLGKVDENIKNTYDKALQYACGGACLYEEQKYLESIFNNLASNKSEIKHYFEPKTMSISPFNFPKKKEEITQNNTFSDFKTDFEKIKKFENRAFVDTCFALLEKYFSYTPCQIKGLEDVSLYDHLKTLMGLMVCLEGNKENNELPFLLIKGDISGIQKFIYSDINTEEAGQGKGTAKTLRGKSFYISLLSQFFAEEIIKQINLSSPNIIFSGGGHFNIVAPNTEKVKKILETLEKELNLILIKKIGTSLSLNLAFVYAKSDLYKNNAGNYFYEVNKSLDKNKTQKHKKYLKEVFDNFGKKSYYLQDIKKLGKAMPYSDYLVEFTIKKELIDSKEFINKISDDERMVANFLERSVIYFMPLPTDSEKKKYVSVTEKSLNRLLNDYKDCFDSLKIIKINDTNYDSIKNIIMMESSFPISYSYRFIGNECYKNEEGDVAGFEEISKLNYDSFTRLSYPQLAVMRLDVDNLGGIFAFGLNEKSYLAKIASLSRELTIFFSGYFNNLAKEYQLYITYSGGDDAFIIGSWYNMIHFATRLQEDFKIFTCNNTNLAFSAGIFMCNENYPIAKFAKDAEMAEKKSKSFERNNTNGEMMSKNAICVFDHTLSWESYKSQIIFAEKILEFIENENTPDDNKGKLARSLMHRLLRIIKSSLCRNGNIISRNFNRNISQLHYLFARQGYDHQKLEEVETKSEHELKERSDKIAKIVIQQILNNFSKKTEIKDYLVSMHYILLKTRKL